MSNNNSPASPGFLAKPTVKKTNRKILMAIVSLITVMVLVLMLTMTSGQNKAGEESASAPPQVVEGENKPLAPPMETLGLALPQEVPPTTELSQSKKEEEIKIVGQPQPDREEEARRLEADEVRRRKFEREQQAYASGLLVQRVGAGTGRDSGSVDADGDGYIDNPAEINQPTGADGYDPAADRDKEAFFTRSRAGEKDWVLPYTREAGRSFELKTGTVIPGVMVSGINSDLPGHLIAQVSQNVYDTATGKDLLIPQGSKLFGVYDSRVVYGQSRVLIAWNRALFPDGSSITLEAMPGTDISGYAGFNDKTDNHYLRVFGSAMLMSLVSGGMGYAADSVANNDSASGNTETTTVQDEMTAALAAQLGQTTLQLLQKNLNIKPTLSIRPGYQFNVIVTKNMVFRGAYKSSAKRVQY